VRAGSTVTSKGKKGKNKATDLQKQHLKQTERFNQMLRLKSNRKTIIVISKAYPLLKLILF